MIAVQPEEIHPSLWRAANELYQSAQTGHVDKVVVSIFQGAVDRKQPRHAAWIAFLPGILLGFFGLILGGSLGGGWLLLGLVFSAVVAIRRSGRPHNPLSGNPRLTTDEIAALSPYLRLSAIERAYAEAFFAVVQSTTIAPADRSETLLALRRVMESAERTEAVLRELPADAHAVDKEIARLEERVNSARDEEARAAFAASLSIARERRDGHGEAYRERAEAQTELLRQGMLQIRDAFRQNRLGVSSGDGIATDTLRRLLSDVRHQADATERALAELRA